MLPIELWYYGNELSSELIKKFKTLDVVCKNFLDYVDKPYSGYILKPLALINSEFREILYIDADNNCVKDPTDLFELKEYEKFGAVFWPDFWHTSKDNAIWKITETNKYNMSEQESGQILIDKEKNWKELNLCFHFNFFGDYYYRLLLGDKDTFKFAWLALNSPFHMINIPVGTCGYFEGNTFYGTTMVQHNSDGKIYFLHRNLLKWDVTKRNEVVWQKIIRFLPNADDKKFYLHHPNCKKYYMELGGDIEIIDFAESLGGYEYKCLDILKSWRSSETYRRFVQHSHFAKHRYPDERSFSLYN